ncbi:MULTISPECIES: phosphatase PAP2 family protein [Agrobacterium]|uniref:phosphatase PAP2 family protein n=1 Tax=Agrobacterium TaxID=357 RepID=UPI002A0DDD87|nr:phosphatase PAP2 family protein [Agrobacterium sp. rho-13.3]MDX8311862.1 phosphatase PAP2 family protein [Agrobacterium sp. rho-13.3]
MQDVSSGAHKPDQQVPTGKARVLTLLKDVHPIVIAMFLTVFGGTLLFLGLTSEMLEGETRAFDESILLSLRRPDDLSVPIGPGWLTHVVDDITSLGGTTVLCLITVLTVVYLLIMRQRSTGVFVALSVLGGWAISTSLKIGIARPRPEIVPHLISVNDLSFPSGHAMLSTVTYLTLGALLSRVQTTKASRIYFIAVAIFLSIIIGFSRIYLGVHYPTDVLGGWCAGASWAMLCWILARRFLWPRSGSSDA